MGASLTGESILCFSPDPWGSIWQDKSGLMWALARWCRVVYFEPRPHLPDVWRDLRAGRIGLTDLRRPRLETVASNLYVYHHPLYAPISGREPLRSAFHLLREALWRRTLHRLGISRPILWLYQPAMLDLVGRFNEKLLVYFIVDEYTAYPGLTPAVVKRMQEREAELLRRADVVFTTAATLRDDRLSLNPHTYWVPNAVAYAAYAVALSDPRPEPALIAPLPHPRLAVVGSIGSKVDLPLLHYIATARPDWAIAMVGPLMPGVDTAALAALRALPNVRFLGSVPPADVPYLMRACDVGLIPYRLTPETRHVNPLKVYEYLAMGLPVVSTPLPNLAVPGDLVHVAEGPPAFVEAVARALAEANDETRRAARRAYAATQTWEARAEDIGRHIVAALARRMAGP